MIQRQILLLYVWAESLYVAFNTSNRDEFPCEQDLDSFQMSESSETSCELCLYYQVPEGEACS